MSQSPTAMPNEWPSLPDDAERQPSRRGKLDLAQLYKLRVVNRLSFGEIAKATGLSKSSVWDALQRLEKVLPDPDQVEAYREIRPMLFTAIEEKLMASLADDATIAKASLNNRAYAFQQIHTARRLEEGKSTENMAMLSKLIDQRHNSLFPSTPQMVLTKPAAVPVGADEGPEEPS